MAELFFKRGDPSEDLAGLARRLGRLLGLGDLEHRESSNYFGGEYFLSSALGVEVTFASADDDRVENREFSVNLGVTSVLVDHPESMLEALSDLLARHLAIAGEDVLRMIDAWSADKYRRLFYQRNANAERFTAEEVTVVER
jgi:hypothetical protein